MSRSIEDYLRVIHSFHEMGVAAKTTDLAEKLRVTPPSVTEMIKRMAEEGLVDYQPYKGVTLTAKGLVYAEKIVRKHRLLERFLHDVLGLKRERVHEEACELEHSLSDEVADAMCKSMDQPELCPDDDKPIPPCVLDVEDCSGCAEAHGRPGSGSKLVTRLSSLRTGHKAIVLFIQKGSTATRRLLEMGLTPGTGIEILAAAPLNGPIQVKVRNSSVAVGRGLASAVVVEVLDEEVVHQVTKSGRHKERRHRGKAA
ncbi:MAG: metal-dependent transcriptional regulator [Candidatus Thorarchaeota archaeon]|nr:metal-dependent transcriptional regulator [Candidatus Thorarchaeota archaeon]